MSLDHPWSLAILGMTVGLALLAARSGLRRSLAWHRLGLAGDPPAVPTLGWLLAASLLILALAGPRWGSRVENERGNADSLVVFLIDVSRSMAARDAVPDRLAVAVESASELVRSFARNESTRVAVVAFAGRGVVRCPPTANLGAVLDVIDSLRAGTVRPGGSNLADALATGFDLIAADRARRGECAAQIIALSDGEDLAGGFDDSTRDRLASSGVPVHGLSIGDAGDGHPVPIVAPGGGETGLTYQGATVETRRRDDLLVDAARISGGAFLPIGLSRPDGLALLFRDQIEPASNGTTTRAGASISSREDRSSLFLLASIACLAVTACRPWTMLPSRAWKGVAALVAALLLTASDRPPGTWLDALQEGQRATALGDLAMALSAYERATHVNYKNVIAHGNAAAILARLGRPAEALAHLDRALAAGPDLDWRGRLEFARGNALARLGRPRDAIAAYDLCLAITEVGMPLHDDALVNREAVERLIVSSSRPGDEEDPRGPGAGHSPDDEQRPDPEEGSPSRPRQTEPGGPSSPSPAPESKSLTAEDRLNSAVAAIRSARDRREGAMTPQPIPLSREDAINGRRDW